MFIPRQPVIENQFCQYGPQTATGSAGIGGVICYAGAVVYLDAASTNAEAIVYRYNTYATDIDAGSQTKLTAAEQIPFGFAMQKVKTGYHQVHPAGYYMPGDLGSSDVIAQPTYNASGAIVGTKAAPMGVAHLGIYDTVHYTCANTTGTVADGAHMKPGDLLYAGCNCGSRVTNVADVATDDTKDYKAIVNTIVGRVMRGASAAKCTANIANTTLYPIRIKLLV